MNSYKQDWNSTRKARAIIEAQTDGVLALKLSILLLPSTAERVKSSDLPGYKQSRPEQLDRIRQLLADRDNELIQNRK